MRFRRLHMESLENRRLLAGDVQLSVSRRGDVTIRGDALANDIELVALGNNQWEVTGNGTTINGQANAQVFTTVRSITIDLRDGDNVLTVDGALAQNAIDITTPNGNVSLQNLSIRSGRGSDDILVENLAVSGDVSIDAGAGINTIAMANVYAGDDLLIRTGSGGDVVTADAIRVRGDLTVITKEGEDEVTLTGDAIIEGDAKIDTGNPADFDLVVVDGLEVWGDLNIDTGDGDDVVDLGALTVIGDLEIETDDGFDEVIVADTTVLGDVEIDTGDDDDTLDMTTGVALFGDLEIDTGDGNDLVEVTDVTDIDRFFLDLGDGDDEAILLASAANQARINGGRGQDSLDFSGSTAGRLQVRGIEDILQPVI